MERHSFGLLRNEEWRERERAGEWGMKRCIGNKKEHGERNARPSLI